MKLMLYGERRHILVDEMDTIIKKYKKTLSLERKYNVGLL